MPELLVFSDQISVFAWTCPSIPIHVWKKISDGHNLKFHYQQAKEDTLWAIKLHKCTINCPRTKLNFKLLQRPQEKIMSDKAKG